jgi:hypothetical protein
MERYFARIENNIVTSVIVADFEFIKKIEGYWLECGNDSGRNNASTGYLYIQERDNFTSPKPFESWILDDKCNWISPRPHPNDGLNYFWNEEILNWELVIFIED